MKNLSAIYAEASGVAHDTASHEAGLRAVEAAVRADQIEKDAEPLRIARQLVDMYRNLVMDTPEDQRIHDAITASADRAFAALGVPVEAEHG